MSIDLRIGRWQDVLTDVPDGSVRLLLTSPPYDNARTYEGTNERVDFGELAAFALRVLCPGGTLAMVLDAPMKDGVQSVTPYRVLVEWAALGGWAFRQFLAYGRGGVPGNTPGWFRRDHEPLLVFVRDGGERVCEKERIATRATKTAGVARTKRMRGGTMVPSASAGALDSMTKHRGSLWSYDMGNGQDPSGPTLAISSATRSRARPRSPMRLGRSAVASWALSGCRSTTRSGCGGSITLT